MSRQTRSRRRNNIRFTFWRRFSLVVLASAVGLSTGALAQDKAVEVGKKVVEGMAITVELEEPKRMQMKMGGGMGQMGGMGSMGQWKTFRPKPGELTHHLTVSLSVAETGAPIPYVEVSATLVHRQSKERMEKELPPMLGTRFIYGNNVFLKPGTYDLTLAIGAPEVMRIEGAMDRWLEPVKAKFTFEVK